MKNNYLWSIPVKGKIMVTYSVKDGGLSYVDLYCITYGESSNYNKSIKLI